MQSLRNGASNTISPDHSPIHFQSTPSITAMALRKQKTQFCHRHRSFSEDTNSPYNQNSTTMGIDNTLILGNTFNNKMASVSVTKKHPHLHRHGNRPRSKSCDRHVHKKNNSTKRNPGTQSPSRHHLHGRVSPKTLPCQQLHGRLWIRPVVVKRNSIPFKPVMMASAVAPQVSEDVSSNSNGTFAPISSKDDPLIRQVTDYPDYDEEMMWATSQSSSFQSLQRRGTTSPKRTRITFGESGKPIQPRNAF